MPSRDHPRATVAQPTPRCWGFPVLGLAESYLGSQGGTVVKNLPANARDTCVYKRCVCDPWVGKTP